VRITPFKVLEEHARKEYKKRFAHVPEPRVINARALASLDAPRSFIWGGIGYWCPPLSYESGFRLLIAANALRDLRGRDDDTARRVAITAARLIRKNIRSRRPFWRLTRAFYRDPPEQLEAVIRGLLYVEDESTVVPSDRPVTVDLMDNHYTFQSCRDGFGRKPDSWADYVYGLRHIGRAATRSDLRMAIAYRVGANADKRGWEDFDREARAMAGWN
jgi:hypothetical protein